MHQPILKTAAITLTLLTLSLSVNAQPKYTNFPSETAVPKTKNGQRILHEDDFSKDTLHRIWGTASTTTKIEDGVIKVLSKGGPSGKIKVSVEPFVNCQLRCRFQFLDSKSLGFGFDDLTAKEILHGGHILGIRFDKNGSIQIKDNLTGSYNMEYYQLVKDKKATPELKAVFARCEKQADYPFESEKWYDALIEINGDTVAISMNGSKVIEFQSPGFAHPRKDMYRFLIGNGELHIDDVSLISTGN
jgi:hypothetical protein